MLICVVYVWIYRAMKTYAPISEQPSITRKQEELRDEEVPIYENMMNAEFVEKFVAYLSLEEHKRKDKFRTKIMTLFKVSNDRYTAFVFVVGWYICTSCFGMSGCTYYVVPQSKFEHFSV